MKIIFAGTPEFAAVALKTLLENTKSIDSNIDVIAVYTQPDRPSGRGRKLKQSEVKQLALLNEIPVYQPDSLKSTDSQTEFAALNADLMVVAAYGLLLPQAILDAPKLGCINIHASLLPRWRGAAPIHRAILAGDKQTGITIMKMDIGLDTGDMLLKETCDILPEDTSSTLHDRLAEIGGQTLLTALNDIAANTIQPEKQNNDLAVYAKKLIKSESEINWSDTAEKIDQQIRGLNPWPIAQTIIEGKVLRVWNSEITTLTSNAKPGEVIAANKNGIDVVTGEGVVRITSVQMPGKKPMDAASFINAHDIVGKQLGDQSKVIL